MHILYYVVQHEAMSVNIHFDYIEFRCPKHMDILSEVSFYLDDNISLSYVICTGSVNQRRKKWRDY